MPRTRCFVMMYDEKMGSISLQNSTTRYMIGKSLFTTRDVIQSAATCPAKGCRGVLANTSDLGSEVTAHVFTFDTADLPLAPSSRAVSFASLFQSALHGICTETETPASSFSSVSRSPRPLSSQFRTSLSCIRVPIFTTAPLPPPCDTRSSTATVFAAPRAAPTARLAIAVTQDESHSTIRIRLCRLQDSR